MLTYISIIVTAIFINNIVLSQFLGICPFLGVSKHTDLVFLQTILFILVIASLVQMLEIVIKKIAPAMYEALGVFLPLITTNCAVLGVAILVVQKGYTLMESVVYGLSTSIGFTLALFLFAGIREQLEVTSVPKGMKGVPLALIGAGILAMAFMGFSGIKIGG